MEIIQKIKALNAQSDIEPDDYCYPVNNTIRSRSNEDLNISSALLPNGRRITLLKTNLTSACERNCYYCGFRCGRDFQRLSLTPAELARAFYSFHRAGIVEGIFLSSGLAGGGVRTQDKLIDTADILRTRYHYRGYIHLKIMPGAEFAQVERSMQLADRVSVNLEAPNPERLRKLAPLKKFDAELLTAIQWMSQVRSSDPVGNNYKNRWPSISTQFVVGAAGETDVELLQTSNFLYKNSGLARTYFSSFTPIPDTPLESSHPGSLVRQRRLYQASYLLRDYGFDLEDLPFEGSGDLPLSQDPKLAWALNCLRDNPIEVTRAERHELLRIPGIGIKTAEMILKSRKSAKICNISDLKRLGVLVDRSEPFIMINGRRPTQQLSFWPR